MKLIEYEKIGEKVYHHVLDNKLNIYVLPKRGFNKYFAFFATNYGGCDRRFALGGKWVDTPAGVAHLLEHKMFDTEEGNALMQLSLNGASPNAYTSTGITAYHFECADNFYDNLRILLSFVSIPYFTPESVEKEQGIIAQEILMGEDNPTRAVYQNLLRALYAHNPVRDPIAGTVESIAEITADTLYDCHKVFYNPSNMVLCVAGDLDAQKVIDTAREIIVQEAGELPQRDYGEPETLYPNKKKYEVNMEVAAPLFRMGSKFEQPDNGEEYFRFLLLGNLACAVLAGTSSPLYARMYAKGLINNRFGAGFSYVPGGMYACAVGESREPLQVMDEITAEADRISREGVDVQLFERLKKASIGNYLRDFDDMENITAYLADGHFKGYDPMKGLDYYDKISIDEIQRFISDAFNPERLAISIVWPNEADN